MIEISDIWEPVWDMFWIYLNVAVCTTSWIWFDIIGFINTHDGLIGGVPININLHFIIGVNFGIVGEDMLLCIQIFSLTIDIIVIVAALENPPPFLKVPIIWVSHFWIKIIQNIRLFDHFQAITIRHKSPCWQCQALLPCSKLESPSL